MKRREFFKMLGLGAVGITLTACTSSAPREVECAPKPKPKAKSKQRPYGRISISDTTNALDELRATYPEHAIWSGGVELTDETTTYRSVRNENILIRMDVSKPNTISVYDMIDINRC